MCFHNSSGRVRVTFDKTMFSEENGTIIGFSIIVKEVRASLWPLIPTVDYCCFNSKLYPMGVFEECDIRTYPMYLICQLLTKPCLTLLNKYSSWASHAELNCSSIKFNRFTRFIPLTLLCWRKATMTATLMSCLLTESWKCSTSTQPGRLTLPPHFVICLTPTKVRNIVYYYSLNLGQLRSYWHFLELFIRSSIICMSI